jgi:hypothetical protein
MIQANRMPAQEAAVRDKRREAGRILRGADQARKTRLRRLCRTKRPMSAGVGPDH